MGQEVGVWSAYLGKFPFGARGAGGNVAGVVQELPFGAQGGDVGGAGVREGRGLEV